MKRHTYTRTTFHGKGIDGYRPYRGTSPADVAAAALDAAIDRIQSKRADRAAVAATLASATRTETV